ncbi:hypothetical protein Trydic_g13125, partial [Trypoxylus dichotomus]
MSENNVTTDTLKVPQENSVHNDETSKNAEEEEQEEMEVSSDEDE